MLWRRKIPTTEKPRLKRQKTLIIGASGFVGKNLVLQYTQRSDVNIMVRPSSNIELFKNNPRVNILYGDLAKNTGIAEALGGIDIVIHCAATTMGRSFWEFYRTNTQGTAHLIDAMLSQNVHKMIYVSSHAACGPSATDNPSQEHDPKNPISFYGRTKHLAEKMIAQSGLDFTIIRPVSVYGPYDKEILTYVKILNQGICPVVGFGEKYINVIYVKDLVDLIIKTIEQNHFTGNTYFVNDGQCYSLDSIMDTIARTLNKRIVKVRVPTPLALFIGLLNDVFVPPNKRLVTRDKVRELACRYWVCSSENVSRAIGFNPRYTFEQGIVETIQWYRNQGHV
jgi:nucleoside-diphosphate-sugar epimerase